MRSFAARLLVALLAWAVIVALAYATGLA